MLKSNTLPGPVVNRTSDNRVSRTVSLNTYTPRTPHGYQDPDDAEALWARFEEDLSGILEKLTTQAPINSAVDIYFTVGRFNPLHPGHITLMFAMIEAARTSLNHYKIIIYAGSGPKNNDKTLKKDAILNILNNPISFQEKKAIIEAILILKYSEEFVRNYIEIIEMGFVPKQLSEVMLEIHASNSGISIRSFRTAGDKPTETVGETDITKSRYVEDFLNKFARENGLNYSSNTLEIPAAKAGAGAEAASATKVRLDALNMLKDEFIIKYLPAYEGLFEGIDIRDELVRIIGAIHDGINTAREREFTYKIKKDTVGTSNISQANIDEYIDSKGKNAMPDEAMTMDISGTGKRGTGTETGNSKKGRTHAGGSRKRQRRQTKRKSKRRQTKRKRQTKRRKSKRRRNR
jgi:nicotinamide mononucleotide adenylyltransferase